MFVFVVAQIFDSTFADNRVSGQDAFGGAIAAHPLNDDYHIEILVQHCTFVNNRVRLFLFPSAGLHHVNGSCQAEMGGAIHGVTGLSRLKIEIVESLFERNWARSGGACAVSGKSTCQKNAYCL